jgi:hypothetical protein
LFPHRPALLAVTVSVAVDEVLSSVSTDGAGLPLATRTIHAVCPPFRKYCITA